MIQSYSLRRIALIAAMFTILLASCGQTTGNSGVATPGATVSPGGGGNLAGTKWVLTALVRNDVQRPPVADSEATVQFTATDVSGKTGCNSFGGSYTVAGTTLKFGQLIQTEMGCLDNVMQQETDFMAILNGAESFTISGAELTITAPEGSLHFKRA